MKLQVTVTERATAVIDTTEVAKSLGRRRLTLGQVVKLLEKGGTFFGDSDRGLDDFDRSCGRETISISVKPVS